MGIVDFYEQLLAENPGADSVDNLRDAMRRFSEQKPVFPGEKAFLLYSTYGLPVDVLRDLCHDRGFLLDEAGLNAAIAEHKRVSRAGRPGGLQMARIVRQAT